ncbi:MAG: hypothetical protein L6R37_001844 [Teloschistes peruensis]|nr:MAG: hypothetical protein L6R37_001844 [Teloschistes peruensis]
MRYISIRQLARPPDYSSPYALVSYLVARDALRQIDLFNAIRSVIDDCVATGGFGDIVGIGKQGGLGIRVGKHDMDLANVRCFDGRAPKEQGCVNTLTLLPYTGDRLRFGRRGLPLVEVPLPQGFRERDPPNSGCSAVVAPKEKMLFLKQWASLFLDASTLNAMCVRRGLNGVYHAKGCE